ncbi:hypothetical protein FANTH_12953 [Fusarium anthophilum]|uniref:Uncharacterized protein n=1 Tax=Fusarium anthophilum TaxID=48485 RepID=A0A8H5DR14_9HYPO|nr:hypothetical protein FANTH_12953 [Fusarium anthophilum]
MPPSRNNKNNDQDRRDRRPGPLSRPPERTSARDESTQPEMGEVGSAKRTSQPTRGLSSTPRGGRSGQQGRGGYSGVGVRGELSSYRPSGALSWSHSQSEAHALAFKGVAAAQMTLVADSGGMIATKLTPTGTGCSGLSNWYAITPEGYWCHLETLTGIDRMAKRLLEDESEAVGVNIVVTPVIPGVFEAIEERHTQKIVMNNHFLGEDGKPAGLFGTGIQPPSEKKPVVRVECEICGSDKHVLSDCVERGFKGQVSGCSICNSRSHYVDSCDHFKAMSLLEKVQTLVQKRANRPPLKTSKPWWKYLHEFCNGEEFVPNVVVDFPWSKPFCESFGWKGMKKMQANFDANPEGYAFDEADEKTGSFEKVFETYWKPAGMAWPAVLGPRIKSEDVGGQVIKTELED